MNVLCKLGIQEVQNPKLSGKLNENADAKQARHCARHTWTGRTYIVTGSHISNTESYFTTRVIKSHETYVMLSLIS